MSVTVVIPTFNRADLCLDAVNAALDQTVPPLEVIVVDDGSTDSTPELFIDAKAPVRYLRQENAERAAARNKGISEAKGELVAFLDSDDQWDPRHLEVSQAALDAHPDAALAFGRAAYYSPEGRVLWEAPSPPIEAGQCDNAVPALTAKGIGFPLSTVVARREILAENPFNEDRLLSRSEDWELWVRIAARHPVVATGEVTAFLRIHQGNTSQDAAAVEEAMKRALGYVLDDPVAGPEVARRRTSIASAMEVEVARLELKVGDRAGARKRLKSLPEPTPDSRRLALTLWLPASITGLARRLRRILAARKHLESK